MEFAAPSVDSRPRGDPQAARGSKDICTGFASSGKRCSSAKSSTFIPFATVIFEMAASPSVKSKVPSGWGPR
jgi:hypothetical protein